MRKISDLNPHHPIGRRRETLSTVLCQTK